MNNNELAIQEVIDTFYKIISGNKEEVRDWDSFLALFAPNARVMPIRINTINESTPLEVEAYVKTLSESLRRNDFYEYGLDYRVDIFKDIAQVYSRYEAKHGQEDEVPIKTGINFVQLTKISGTWKIVSMLWQNE